MEQRTVIGVLASRDDRQVSDKLVWLFDHLYKHPNSSRLEAFHFVFTGGTYERVIPLLGDDIRVPLESNSGVTKLPTSEDGGVIYLSYLITEQKCSIVWPFYAPAQSHWIRPENLAFMRLCDHWHVKRLMNRASVLAWFELEAEPDGFRNVQKLDASHEQHGRKRLEAPLVRPDSSDAKPLKKFDQTPDVQTGPKTTDLKVPGLRRAMKPFSEVVIALIAHDKMKDRMVEFAVDHQRELAKFKRILATGTTGGAVAANSCKEVADKIYRYNSGPKGGDIELATEILEGLCHVVVFFIDPLNPHPHIEDIRVVFEACMINDSVVMITNELHARDFMSRVVRPDNRMPIYVPEVSRPQSSRK